MFRGQDWRVPERQLTGRWQNQICLHRRKLLPTPLVHLCCPVRNNTWRLSVPLLPAEGDRVFNQQPTTFMTTTAASRLFGFAIFEPFPRLCWGLASLCAWLLGGLPAHAGLKPPTPDYFLAAPKDRENELRWAATPRAARYTIRVANAAAGPFTAVATGLTATVWMHTNLANGQARHYQISALNEYGESDTSATLSATPSAPVLDWLVAGAKVEKLAGGFLFTEGPVWSNEEGGYLVFSDIDANRLVRWSPRTGTTTFRMPSNRANGNTRDALGRLITCEQTGRRVSRTELDGTVVTLVNMYSNRTFNAPNDAVVKSDGTIWFTDPNYGGSDAQPGRYVYGFHPDDVSGTLRVAATGFDQPNGLCFSPDESKLYVADSGAPTRIRVFDVMPDNTLSTGRVFTTVTPGAPDGIRADAAGRVFSSAGDGVQIFGTNGALLGRILTPEAAANVGFGGASNQMMFITARTSLYGVTRLPDLLVTNVQRFPTSPRRGQTVFFRATIKNQGTGPTPAGMPLRVMISIGGTNIVWSDNFTGTLPPDASVVVTCNAGVNGPSWIAPGGTHNMRAWVDDQDRVSESNETNNVFTANFSVANAADTDGDGHDDPMEGQAGTNPQDPNSVLRLISSAQDGANGITLTWASVSNRTYRITCKGDLNEVVWSELTGPIRATDTATTWRTNFPAGTGPIFFRIRTP